MYLPNLGTGAALWPIIVSFGAQLKPYSSSFNICQLSNFSKAMALDFLCLGLTMQEAMLAQAQDSLSTQVPSPLLSKIPLLAHF